MSQGKKDRIERKRSKKSERLYPRKSHKSHDSKRPKRANKITADDYFLRQTEFRVWLVQTKNKYMDDLSTKDAMELFTDEFSRDWNRGKLARQFYEGLPNAVVEQTKRTRHQWGFVATLGDKERFELATTKDSVNVATKQKQMFINDVKDAASSKTGGTSTGNKRQINEEENSTCEFDRKRLRAERRRKHQHLDVIMDELVPKATGREAQIEKRRQFGNKLHGAARDREDARDGLDLSENFLMGGRDDLKRRLAQRDLARSHKQEQRQQKLADYQAKESARMDKFLEDMGLAGPNGKGGKQMAIASRRTP